MHAPSFNLFKPFLLAGIGIVLSLLLRSTLLPQWTPLKESNVPMSLLIWWMISTLPVAYLAVRHWIDKSTQHFMLTVCLYFTIAFGIQTALKATMDAFNLINIDASAFSPLVWLLPWFSLTTIWKNSYSTSKQCIRLIFKIIPLVLFAHLMYLYAPLIALAYSGIESSAITLVAVAALLYMSLGMLLARSQKMR